MHIPTIITVLGLPESVCSPLQIQLVLIGSSYRYGTEAGILNASPTISMSGFYLLCASSQKNLQDCVDLRGCDFKHVIRLTEEEAERVESSYHYCFGAVIKIQRSATNLIFSPSSDVNR